MREGNGGGEVAKHTMMEGGTLQHTLADHKTVAHTRETGACGRALLDRRKDNMATRGKEEEGHQTNTDMPTCEEYVEDGVRKFKSRHIGAYSPSPPSLATRGSGAAAARGPLFSMRDMM